MNTKRELIIQKVVERITGSGIAPVYRSRKTALDKKKTPAIVVEKAEDTPTEEVVGFIDWKLQLRVMVYSRADVPDVASDPVEEKIHELLMSDTSLDGLAMGLRPSPTVFEVYEAETTAGVAVMGFVVDYRTKTNTLVE